MGQKNGLSLPDKGHDLSDMEDKGGMKWRGADCTAYLSQTLASRPAFVLFSSNGIASLHID